MNKKSAKPQHKNVNPRGTASKSARNAPPRPNPQNPQQKPPQRRAPRNPRQRPSRPQNPQADKAMKAAMRRRSPQTRTRRFRGGNYILYYLLAAIVVVVVLIILANTVLFKCNRIEVTGNNRYTPEEITDVCGIVQGDNLLRIDTSAAENRIANSLVYIDSATVKRSFPTRVEITVMEAEKWYCVEQSGVTAAISRGGKVVEQCAPEDYPIVRGLDAESVEPGAWLKSKTEGKTEMPGTLLNAADKAGLTGITSVDITDKFSVKMVLDNRITLDLGTVSEVDSKLLNAKSIIDRDIHETDNVTLLLSNPDKVALQYNQPETPPQSTSSSSTSTSESSSSEPENSDPEEPE